MLNLKLPEQRRKIYLEKEAINNYNLAPDGLPIIGLPYLVLMKINEYCDPCIPPALSDI